MSCTGGVQDRAVDGLSDARCAGLGAMCSGDREGHG